MSDFIDLRNQIRNFCAARDWHQFNRPQNLAISLSLEAAEVLEHFQWLTDEQVPAYIKKNKDDIGEEIADVAIYLIELADSIDLDLRQAIEKKIEKNGKKYPVEKAKGNAKKYTKL